MPDAVSKGHFVPVRVTTGSPTFVMFDLETTDLSMWPLLFIEQSVLLVLSLYNVFLCAPGCFCCSTYFFLVTKNSDSLLTSYSNVC